MKTLLIVLLATLPSFAQYIYGQNKIDMHGGNHNSLYEKNSFRSSSMGMSALLDRNTSKNTKPSSLREIKDNIKYK